MSSTNPFFVVHLFFPGRLKNGSQPSSFLLILHKKKSGSRMAFGNFFSEFRSTPCTQLRPQLSPNNKGLAEPTALECERLAGGGGAFRSVSLRLFDFPEFLAPWQPNLISKPKRNFTTKWKTNWSVSNALLCLDPKRLCGLAKTVTTLFAIDASKNLRSVAIQNLYLVHL